MTPHLDKMAQEGMRFTQFYSACMTSNNILFIAPVCTPSRAAFMTGRYVFKLISFIFRFSVRSGMFSQWNNSATNVMVNVLHADGRGGYIYLFIYFSFL